MFSIMEKREFGVRYLVMEMGWEMSSANCVNNYKKMSASFVDVIRKCQLIL